MTSHHKVIISPEVRAVILGALKAAYSDGPDISPGQLASTIQFMCQGQGFPIPPQRIVNKYLRELGIAEKVTKVWLIPKNILSGPRYH
jgi:hypothetical protein